jgi:immune inhibitor A
VYRLWKDGAAGKEYFLVENRQRKLYDQKLPGDGLLVYHIDEAIDSNENENHPFIKLLEADAKGHLHDGANRGDAGDPYPGSAKNIALTRASNPSSKSYASKETFVTLTEIGASAANIKVRIGVKGPAKAAARKTGKTKAKKAKKAKKAGKSRRSARRR